MSTSLTVRDIDPADKSGSGAKHGIELPPPAHRGYKPLSLAEEDGE